MNKLNEYSKISEVAIRSPLSSFVNDEKITNEWASLRFHAKPDLKKAIIEYNYFRSFLEEDGIKIIELKILCCNSLLIIFFQNFF